MADSHKKTVSSRKQRKNQWVVRHPDGWAVKGEGNQRFTRVMPTQREAIDVAIEIAGKQGSEVIVQNRDGEIRLKSQSDNIKALLREWDADPEQEPDEWWDDLTDLLRGEQPANSRNR